MQDFLPFDYQQHPFFRFHSRHPIQMLARKDPACWILVNILCNGHLHELAETTDWIELIKLSGAYDMAFQLAYESVNSVVGGVVVRDLLLNESPAAIYAWWCCQDVSDLAINRPIEGMSFMNLIGYQLQLASERFVAFQRLAA